MLRSIEYLLRGELVTDTSVECSLYLLHNTTKQILTQSPTRMLQRILIQINHQSCADPALAPLLPVRHAGLFNVAFAH